MNMHLNRFEALSIGVKRGELQALVELRRELGKTLPDIVRQVLDKPDEHTHYSEAIRSLAVRYASGGVLGRAHLIARVAEELCSSIVLGLRRVARCEHAAMETVRMC